MPVVGEGECESSKRTRTGARGRGRNGEQGRREMVRRWRSGKKASGEEGMPSEIEKKGRRRCCWMSFLPVFSNFTDPNRFT